MVYFMCEVCANTLKKNQIKRHAGMCPSKSFTCVDCSQTFTGRDLDAHTVCKSEAEKYFGKFYQPKASKPTAGKDQAGLNPQNSHTKSHRNEEDAGNGHSSQQSSHKSLQSIESSIKEERKKAEPWKGWKNEIKRVLVEYKEGIEINDLKKSVVKRFKQCFGNKGGCDEAFERKVHFSRFVKKGNVVFYYRCLKGEEE